MDNFLLEKRKRKNSHIVTIWNHLKKKKEKTSQIKEKGLLEIWFEVSISQF